MNASFTHQYARRRALHPVLALAMVIAPGVPLVAGAETEYISTPRTRLGEAGGHGTAGAMGYVGDGGAGGIPSGENAVRDGGDGFAGGRGGNGGDGGDGGDGTWVVSGTLRNQGFLLLNGPSYYPPAKHADGAAGIAGGDGGDGGEADFLGWAPGFDGTCTAQVDCAAGGGSMATGVDGGGGSHGGGGGGGSSGTGFFVQVFSNGGNGGAGSIGGTGAHGTHGADGADVVLELDVPEYTNTGFVPFGGAPGIGAPGGRGGDGGGAGGGAAGGGAWLEGWGGTGGAGGAGGTGGRDGSRGSGFIDIRSGGVLDNEALITNENEIAIRHGGTLTNRSDALRNFGRIDNDGTLTNTAGMVLINEGIITNRGTVEVVESVIGNEPTMPRRGTYRQTSGETILTNGIISQGSVQLDGGTLTGTGTLYGSTRIKNGAVISPGSTTALLNIVGDLFFSNYDDNHALIEIELGGRTRGDNYDALSVSGRLQFGPTEFDIRFRPYAGKGILDVAWTGGFSASTGDSFDILDWGTLLGEFADIRLPALQQGLTWDLSALYVDGTLAVTGNPVPVPGALWLFGPGVIALRALSARRG